MAMDLLTLEPTPREIDDWCAAVRLTALAHAGTAQGMRGWTDAQRRCLQELFAEFAGKNRSLRLAMGTFILAYAGLTGEPFLSFNDMSEAQASALIDHCFGSSRGQLYRHGQATQILQAIADQLQGETTRPTDFEYLFDL